MISYETLENYGIKVVLVNNICKVRLPKRDKICDGIEVIDTINGRDIVEDAKVIENNFVTTNGRKVRLNRLVRGKIYTLIERVGKEAFAINITKGNSTRINGKHYGDSYVILGIDGKVVAIKKDLFKKMCRVIEEKKAFSNRINIGNRQRNTMHTENTVESAQEQIARQFKEDLSESKESIEHEDKNERKFTLAVQIVNTSEEVIGYAVLDNNGKKYRLSYNKVLQLADKGLVSNAKTVIQGGKKVLKGYATNLDKLSKIYK